MTARPHTPTVLVRIDRNSAVSVLQDAGVQVVLLDERTDPDYVVLLPQRDQYEEILLVLGDRYPVSLRDDHGATAANALAQLYRRMIVASSFNAETGELKPRRSSISNNQEAQR